MDEYAKWMKDAGDSIPAFERIVTTAKRMEPHGALFGLLRSFLMYHHAQPDWARFPALGFLQIIARRFPLNNERLWCWNVNKGYDAESSGEFVARRTCATFLMGEFSIAMEGGMGGMDVELSYSSATYRPARAFWAERASLMVAFRTYPVLYRLAMVDDIAHTRMHMDFMRACNAEEHMQDLTHDDMKAVYRCMSRSAQTCVDFLGSYGGIRLIDDDDATVSAVYTCVGMDMRAREMWMQRGESVLWENVEPERFMREIKRIDYGVAGVGNCERVTDLFVTVCTWASPDQRVSILHALDAANVHWKAGCTSLVNACIAACTPWPKNACG